MKINKQDVLISLIFSVLLAVIIALLFPYEIKSYMLGFFILSFLTTYALLYVIRWADGSNFITWVTSAGFLLRFILAIFFTLGLPIWGYAEPAQEAGYLFTDAYQRDTQAWELASNNEPISKAFDPDSFFSDQYGGLLAFSAMIYRVFSPDLHFKLNVLLLISFVSTLSIPFVYKALKIRNKSDLLITIAVLLLAFYPDAILYSVSEMREGLIIGLSAILFYLLSKPKIFTSKTIAVIILTSVAIFLLNFKLGLFVLFGLGVWYLLFNNNEIIFIKSHRWVAIVIGIAVVLVGIVGFSWLVQTSQWDSALLVMESGWIEKIIHQIGKHYRMPFAMIYGFFRPLLPPAILESSIPLWKTIAIIRSVGWYLLMPVFLYGLVFGVRSIKTDKGRNIALWVLLSAWMLISSIRGGGDQWDNPRYRINFIVLIAVYCAEAFEYYLRHKDHWFIRILAAILIFLGFFFYWYLNRYIGGLIQIDFYLMVALIALCFVAILITGIFYEIKKNRIQTN